MRSAAGRCSAGTAPEPSAIASVHAQLYLQAVRRHQLAGAVPGWCWGACVAIKHGLAVIAGHAAPCWHHSASAHYAAQPWEDHEHGNTERDHHPGRHRSAPSPQASGCKERRTPYVAAFAQAPQRRGILQRQVIVPDRLGQETGGDGGIAAHRLQLPQRRVHLRRVFKVQSTELLLGLLAFAHGRPPYHSIAPASAHADAHDQRLLVWQLCTQRCEPAAVRAAEMDYCAAHQCCAALPAPAQHRHGTMAAQGEAPPHLSDADEGVPVARAEAQRGAVALVRGGAQEP